MSGWPDSDCRAGRIVAAPAPDHAGAMTQTMTQPMSETTLPAPAWREPTRPRGVRRVFLDSGYALSAFFLALPAFIVVVVDLALGLGLIVLVGGLLLLWVAVMVARGFARFERMRLRGMLGKPAPTPAYLCPRPEDGFWRKALLPLRDAQSWLDVLWCVVGLVTGTFAFALTLAWWAAAAGGLTYWFWQRGSPTTRTPTPPWPSCSASARAGTRRSCSTSSSARSRWSRCRWWCGSLPPCTVASRTCCSAAAPSSSRRYAGSRAAATPPGRPRRARCAGSSATSTTGRSSGWCG